MHEVYGFSDIGTIRQNNEDFFSCLHEQHFYALADGMGGPNAGEVAAKETLLDICNAALKLREQIKDPRQLLLQLKDAIKDTNRHIHAMGKEHPAFQGMGTTLCCFFLHENQLLFAHVGDSRLYRFSKGRLIRLTEDHSLKNKLIRSGELKRGELLPAPYSHVITKAIGPSGNVEPSISHSPIEDGDLVFICSDGLSDYLPEAAIEEILKEQLSIKATVDWLITAAKEHGSRDNITVLMVRYQP